MKRKVYEIIIYGFPEPKDIWAMASVLDNCNILTLFNGKVEEKPLSFFIDETEKNEGRLKDVKIYAREGWTSVVTVHSRSLWEDEQVFKLATRSSQIFLTKNTHLPVIRDRKEIIIKADELKNTDSLLMFAPLKLKDHLLGEELTRPIINQGLLSFEPCSIQNTKLVGLETEKGYFSANDVIITLAKADI